MRIEDTFVVAEEPFRRRPADAVRLAVALLLLVLAAARADTPSSLEAGVVEFVQSLPEGLRGVFDFFYRFGSLWVVLVLVGLALVVRRFRLARDLAVAGAAAYALARILAFVIDDQGVAKAFDEVARTGVTPSFPLGRIGLVTAVLATAWPYLVRPVRRFGFAVVAVVAVAAVYRGSGLPVDVIGGVLLGWGVAAAVHLGFGSPAGSPTTGQVADALAELGVPVRQVRHDPARLGSGTVMLAEEIDGGAIVIDVFGRDEADAQFLAKAWRFIVFKDSGPTLPLTRLQRVEHEAYVTLAAERAGACVPDVVAAGVAGADVAVLVERKVDARSLATLEPDVVTDDVLGLCWQAVGRLRDARVAHGALDAAHVLVGADGTVTLVGFDRASSSAAPDRLALDVAELLAATAAVVGVERAVAAARARLGDDALVATLPMLQPTALTRRTRSALKGQKHLLDELRNAAAAAVGTEAPKLERLERIRPINVLIFLGTIVGISALLSQIGNPADLIDELRDAEWGWVAVAALFWAGTKFSDAVCMLGAVRQRIAYAPTAVLQFALSFIGFAVPKVGSISLTTRYLQRQGVDTASAVSSGVLPSVVSGVIQAVVTVICIFSVGSQVDVEHRAGGELGDLLLVVLVVGLLAGVVLSVRPVRRRLLPAMTTMARNVGELARSPSKALLMLGGKTLTMLFFAMALGASLRAYGVSTSLSVLIVVNTLSSLVSSAVPVPGGLGVTEAALVALLTSFGVPSTPAVAGVLTYRVFTSWLSPLWGWFAFHYLQVKEYV